MENQGLANAAAFSCRGWSVTSVRFGSQDSFLKQRKDMVAMVSTPLQLVKKLLNSKLGIIPVRAQGENSKDKAKDDASEEAWRVAGGRWNVEV